MTDAEKIEDLLSAWQRGRERGVDAPAAELAADCPELVPELERRVAVLRRMSALAAETGSHEASGESTGGGPKVTAQQPASADLSRLGGFRIVRCLGQGGMGCVYEAEDETLGRRVAVKQMRPDVALRPGARERFLREARSAAALRHDRVVPIYHVGEYGGTPFIVMPLLAGESLAGRLKRGPRPDAAEVVRVGREIAEGLGAAHAAGLVHRDVKPANVWLDGPSGAAKLLDFGLARAADGDSGLTEPGAILGTPAYMAPEQADGQHVDARADLFSLGVVLYEMASGTQPFAADSTMATLCRVLSHCPPPLTEVNGAVPQALSRLVERLMAKEADARPRSAEVVVADLRSIELGCDPDASTASFARAPARPGGGRWPKWLAAGAAAMVVLAGVALALRPQSDALPAPASLATPPSVAQAEALRIVSLHVQHFARRGRDGMEERGVLGQDSFGVHVGDRVRLEATLSRPGYAYLIAFRSDGADELLFPEDEADVPTPTDRPRYPSRSRGDYYGLDEGAGLWVFAALASETKLPAYRDWRTGRAVPWAKAEAPAGTVWLDDGQWVDVLSARGKVRGDRAKGVKVAGQSAVVQVTNWLKDSGAVMTVGVAAEAR